MGVDLYFYLMGGGGGLIVTVLTHSLNNWG